MRVRRLAYALVALMVVQGIGCASTTTTPDPSVDWDQAQVTHLAKKLPSATGKLYVAVWDQSRSQGLPSSFDSGPVFHLFRDQIRIMRAESIHLAEALEKGADREATTHAFRRAFRSCQGALETAKGHIIDEAIRTHLDHVKVLLARIEPYYGVGGS